MPTSTRLQPKAVVAVRSSAITTTTPTRARLEPTATARSVAVRSAAAGATPARLEPAATAHSVTARSAPITTTPRLPSRRKAFTWAICALGLLAASSTAAQPPTEPAAGNPARADEASPESEREDAPFDPAEEAPPNDPAVPTEMREEPAAYVASTDDRSVEEPSVARPLDSPATEASASAPGDRMDEAPGADEVDEPAHAHRGGLVEELTYEQHPGLPPAASKIFFSERRYAISGFGELAYTHYFGDKNRASGDIELFNTNLYRFVLYGAYRATDWLVLYAEVFAEFFHDGLREHAHELFVEAFVDFVISKPFGLRLGWFQVPIGYVNNNDEPIMFYSVNRPEVERLIIPTQWIELGAQAYGRIGDRASWLVGAFQGVQGRDLVGASWLRRGRENNVRMNFDSIAVAGQVNVYPIDGLSLSVSGMFAQSGNHERVAVGGEDLRVTAPTGILSGYARYETGAWSLMAMGVLGWMGQTDRMYHLTALGEEGPQILGARTYGYYFEVGFDLLHYLPRIRREPRETFLWRTQEMRLPLFVRYERLDTHDRVAGSLAAQMTEADLLYRSNLDILTFGANFNLRRNVVLKANYQVRRNRERAPHLAVESNRFETGLGFIF